MELADSYDSLAEVPAEHTALYVERDGKVVLELKGLKTQADFEAYGAALKKRFVEKQAADAANSNDVDLDPKSIKKLISDSLKELGLGKKDKDGGGDNDSGEVHELRRELAAVKSELQETKDKEASASAQAQTTKIKTSLQGVAAKSGVRPSAIDAFVDLIQPNFEVSADGNVVAKLEGNNLPGVTPNSNPSDVITTLQRNENYSYFWPDSKGAGGGSNNGGGGGGGGSDNPWSEKGWNMTKQGEMVTADRANAEALAKQAGSYIGATEPAKK